MSFPLVVLTFVFLAITSGILIRLAVRVRVGAVGLPDLLRLYSLAPDPSGAVYQKGYEAAWFLLLAGNLMMDFRFIGLLPAAFFTGSEGLSLARVLVLTGVIMAITLMLAARAAVDSAAKDSTR